MKSIKNKNEIKKHFCSVTKKMYPSENMIRFVLFPDNKYTIDLNYEFQGKEFFIFASKSTLARIKDFVGDIYEKEPQVENLVTRIDSIIVKRIVSLIALARKSGKVILGYDKIQRLLLRNKIELLLQAKDGSLSRRSGLALPKNQEHRVYCLSQKELGIPFRKNNVSNIGFLKSSFTIPLIFDIARLASLRSCLGIQNKGLINNE